jgi:hypothetical protein
MNVEGYKPNLPDRMARMDTIFEMRQSGMTLRQIGKNFGISQDRVRQLLFIRQRIHKWWRNYFELIDGLTREERMALDVHSIPLSTRAYNALRDYRRKYTVADVMEMSDEELLKLPGMGQFTISETRKSIAFLLATAAPAKEKA